MENREDLLGQREGAGKCLFRYYRDLIRLRRRHHTFATPNINIVLTHNADRMLAFHRWRGPEHYLVVATLSDGGWPDGYLFHWPSMPSGRWREVFTSDAAWYGGGGLTNDSEIEADGEKLLVKVPPRGLVVMRHMPQS
jgi:1,4-alpha-glucan branching enzyme